MIQVAESIAFPPQSVSQKGLAQNQGHRLVQSRVRQARCERRPTIEKRLTIVVRRRAEAPLVPRYILPCFKKALALAQDCVVE